MPWVILAGESPSKIITEQGDVVGPPGIDPAVVPDGREWESIIDRGFLFSRYDSGRNLQEIRSCKQGAPHLVVYRNVDKASLKKIGGDSPVSGVNKKAREDWYVVYGNPDEICAQPGDIVSHTYPDINAIKADWGRHTSIDLFKSGLTSGIAVSCWLDTLTEIRKTLNNVGIFIWRFGSQEAQNQNIDDVSALDDVPFPAIPDATIPEPPAPELNVGAESPKSRSLWIKIDNPMEVAQKGDIVGYHDIDPETVDTQAHTRDFILSRTVGFIVESWLLPLSTIREKTRKENAVIWRKVENNHSQWVRVKGRPSLITANLGDMFCKTADVDPNGGEDEAAGRLEVLGAWVGKKLALIRIEQGWKDGVLYTKAKEVLSTPALWYIVTGEPSTIIARNGDILGSSSQTFSNDDEPSGLIISGWAGKSLADCRVLNRQPKAILWRNTRSSKISKHPIPRIPFISYPHLILGMWVEVDGRDIMGIPTSFSFRLPGNPIFSEPLPLP